MKRDIITRTRYEREKKARGGSESIRRDEGRREREKDIREHQEGTY